MKDEVKELIRILATGTAYIICGIISVTVLSYLFHWYLG